VTSKHFSTRHENSKKQRGFDIRGFATWRQTVYG